MKKEINKHSFPRYSEAFKMIVVRDVERGVLSKDQVQRKYGIGGNSQVLDWCRKYGSLPYPQRRQIIGRPMNDPQKQRIKELEQQLADAQLKVSAYEKLIAIAEKEQGVSILKKDGVKQLPSLRRPTHEK